MHAGYKRTSPESLSEKFVGIVDTYERLNKTYCVYQNKRIEKEIESLFVELHSFKDWAGKELRNQTVVDNYVKSNYYLGLVGDFANTVKHRKLRPKSFNYELYRELGFPRETPELTMEYAKPEKKQPCIENYFLLNNGGESVMAAYILEIAIRKWGVFLNKQKLRV